MRKIVDEIYMTVDAETETHWIIRFSIKTKVNEGGYWQIRKVFNDNERALYAVGVAQYMFIFEEDGKVGTMILKLEDKLFAPGAEEEYNSTIDEYRSRILDDTILSNTIKLT